MKVKTLLLPLLIWGSLSVSGLSEQPSQKLARKAVCMVKCRSSLDVSSLSISENYNSQLPINLADTSYVFSIIRYLQVLVRYLSIHISIMAPHFPIPNRVRFPFGREMIASTNVTRLCATSPVSSIFTNIFHF